MTTTLSIWRSPSAAIAVLTMCASGLAACGSSDESASPSGSTTPVSRQVHELSGDWLLYQHDGTERTEVALIHPDGSGRWSPMVGLVGGDQTNPDWDPSGTRVAFTMSDGETDDLWTAAVDGSGATKILDCVRPCQWIDDASWSPDGESIVFSRTVARGGRGIGTLETIDVDSGRTSIIRGPSTRSFTAGARWSPDGRCVVFELVHKVGPALDADVDGVVLSIVRLDEPDQPVRGLTDPHLYAATADWSRHGRRIVYSALATPAAVAPDLFTIALRGGSPTRVTRLAPRGGFAAEPTFTADGRRIVFSGRVDSPGAPLLLTVSTSGGRVTSATGAVETPGRHPRVPS